MNMKMKIINIPNHWKKVCPKLVSRHHTGAHSKLAIQSTSRMMQSKSKMLTAHLWWVCSGSQVKSKIN